MHRKGLRPAIEQDIFHFAPNYKPESAWAATKRIVREFLGFSHTAVPS